MLQEEDRERKALYFNSDRHSRLEDYQTSKGPVKILNVNNKNPHIVVNNYTRIKSQYHLNITRCFVQML